MDITAPNTPAPAAAPPRNKRRFFLWVFLAIQAIFIIWLVAGAHTSTAPTASQLTSLCGSGKWYPLFKSQADCVQHGGAGLQQAGDLGKGIGLALVFAFWVGVDIVLGIGYGIYRLARR